MDSRCAVVDDIKTVDYVSCGDDGGMEHVHYFDVGAESALKSLVAQL